MKRQRLLATLADYQRLWLGPKGRHASFDAGEEEGILNRFAAFVEATPDCFERGSPLGHVTGSALVTTPDLGQVLLTLHGKLGLWLQLGGHADGHPRPEEVAWREVEEESGLTRLSFLAYEPALGGSREAAPMPFDFDAHVIPARRDEPAHIHYDVRFLIVADPAEPVVISSESKDLRWFTRAEAYRVTNERSMHRQFDKLAHLAQLTGGSPALS